LVQNVLLLAAIGFAGFALCVGGLFARRILRRRSSEERRSFDLARRLTALWRIVNQAGISDNERLQALLDFSTRSIRPDRPFVGLLTHLEEGTVVVDAVSLHREAVAGMESAAVLLRPGEPFPFDATVHRRLFAGGKAQSWDDLARPDADAPESGALAWRAILGTTFELGSKRTFLVFGSPQPMTDERFGEDDLAFVDVLASIVANRLQQQLLAERLRYQIEHDLLTGLPNRVQFRLAVRNAVASRRPCAIALVNLDDFSVLNNVQGQMVGDEVLIEIGVELDAVSEFDLVSRLEGDTFGILIHDVTDEFQARAQAHGYVERFRRPFNTGDREGTRRLSVGASVGMALFPGDGDNGEELTRRAMLALEAAKKRGGGRLLFFHNEMEDAYRRERVVRTELLEAIADDQFELEYQPTFELESRALTGAEALIRWSHPQRGFLPPAEFIPFAEQSRIINAIGRWVLVRAIRDLSSLGTLPPGFRCYINVAPSQLREPDFVASLRAELARSPEITNHLGIEVTESGAMEHIEASITALVTLRELGLKIALDDFGTGHSSLSYLKRLPLHLVKLDRSFVAGLPGDPHDTTLCEAMLSIASRFGFSTLAEGIENEVQASWLAANGCRFGQGFALGVPAGLTDLKRRLDEGVRLDSPR
jgi:diguanylate cyclase (GGDEF)-like protein